MVSISAVLLCVLLRRMFRGAALYRLRHDFFWSAYYCSYQVPDLRGEHIALCLLEAQVNSLYQFASSCSIAGTFVEHVFPVTDRLTSNIASNLPFRKGLIIYGNGATILNTEAFLCGAIVHLYMYFKYSIVYNIINFILKRLCVRYVHAVC